MKKIRSFVAFLLCLMLTVCSFTAAFATTKVDLEFTLYGSETVTMVTPGVIFSVIKSDGQNVTVETAGLEWETEAAQNKRVAVISAPRSGRSVVMSSPNGSAHTIGRFSTGKIVIVLKKSISKYTGVLYNGKLGYVLTSTLTYPDASKGVTKGQVVWTDGTANGRKTINLREKTSRSSRKLASIKTGTEVTIYGESGAWTEVDVSGWHGYIQTQYIAVTDDTLTYPAATETETPAATAEPVVEEEVLSEDADEAAVETEDTEEDAVETEDEYLVENDLDEEEDDASLEDEEGWDEGL